MNLEMSLESRKNLQSLSDEADCSLAEVIRRSLAVYELLRSEMKKGGKIVIRNGEDEREVWIM